MNALGDRVIIGERGINYAFIYAYINGTWTIMNGGTLNPTTGTFGFTSSMNSVGDRAIIGSPSFNSNQGVVYIYSYTSSWSVMTGGTITGPSTGSGFSLSLSMNALGDRVAIGAPGVNSSAGAVYIYTYVNGSWINTNVTGSTFTGDNITNTQFGWKCALNGLGNVVLVSTYYNNASFINKAYIYNEYYNTRYCNDIAVNSNNYSTNLSNTIWVAGGGSSGKTINPLAYSIDGKTWYASLNGTATFPFSNSICNAIAWGGTKWVAGGSGTNPMAYSYDGKTWYASINGASLLSSFTCNAITWNSTYWVASGNNIGGSSAQAYSTDGIIWILSVNGNTLYSNNNALAIASRKSSSQLLINQVYTLTNQQFGIGQTWTNMESLRANGVTYTNNYTKPIMVSVVSYNPGTGFVFWAFVNGLQIGYNTFNTIGSQSTLTFIVPPGSTYKCVTSSPPFTTWYEMY